MAERETARPADAPRRLPDPPSEKAVPSRLPPIPLVSNKQVAETASREERDLVRLLLNIDKAIIHSKGLDQPEINQSTGEEVTSAPKLAEPIRTNLYDAKGSLPQADYCIKMLEVYNAMVRGRYLSKPDQEGQKQQNQYEAIIRLAETVIKLRRSQILENSDLTRAASQAKEAQQLCQGLIEAHKQQQEGKAVLRSSYDPGTLDSDLLQSLSGRISYQRGRCCLVGELGYQNPPESRGNAGFDHERAARMEAMGHFKDAAFSWNKNQPYLHLGYVIPACQALIELSDGSKDGPLLTSEERGRIGQILVEARYWLSSAKNWETDYKLKEATSSDSKKAVQDLKPPNYFPVDLLIKWRGLITH